MKTAARWILIITAALLAAACDRTTNDIAAPPISTQFSSAAERTVQESLYDLTDVYFTFPCDANGNRLADTDGEYIRMEGQIYERITVVYDAAGGLHYALNTMPVGLRGTGVASGEEFRVSENEQAVANQRLAGGTGTYRQELKMIGKDTGRTFWLVATGGYVITPDGEFEMSREQISAECRVRN